MNGTARRPVVVVAAPGGNLIRQLTEETIFKLKKPKYTFQEWCVGRTPGGK